MKKYEMLKTGLNLDSPTLCGDTVEEAIKGREKELIYYAKNSDEKFIKLLETKIEYIPTILGGTGGTVVTFYFLASTQYMEDSPNYAKFNSYCSIWVYTDKDGNPRASH